MQHRVQILSGEDRIPQGGRMARVTPTLGAICVLTATLAAQQPAPAFEVASVRRNTIDKGIPFGPTSPDGINLINRPVESLVRSVYDVQFFRLFGLPAWANEERYDVIANAARPITEAERRLMLRSLLIDRFGRSEERRVGKRCRSRW